MARRLAAKSQTTATAAPAAPAAVAAPAGAATVTLKSPSPIAGNGAATAPRSARPTQHEIAKRAYEIWVASGRVEGRDLQNWKQAEKELGAA